MIVSQKLDIYHAIIKILGFKGIKVAFFQAWAICSGLCDLEVAASC